jgi:hypothetical protein
MSPSNMELRIGTIEDYNNEIVVATGEQTLGVNNTVNAKLVTHTSQHTTIQGTTTKKSLPEPKKSDIKPLQENKPFPDNKQPNILHEDNKTALIIGSIAIGFITLLIYEIY